MALEKRTYRDGQNEKTIFVESRKQPSHSGSTIALIEQANSNALVNWYLTEADRKRIRSEVLREHQRRLPLSFSEAKRIEAAIEDDLRAYFGDPKPTAGKPVQQLSEVTRLEDEIKANLRSL